MDFCLIRDINKLKAMKINVEPTISDVSYSSALPNSVLMKWLMP